MMMFLMFLMHGKMFILPRQPLFLGEPTLTIGFGFMGGAMLLLDT